MGRPHLGILLLAVVLAACGDCSGETSAGSIACEDTSTCPSGLVCRDGRCARPGDADGDGLDDLHDNCPDASNIDQADHDGDGKGDVCDDDRDGDGQPNDKDNCAEIANPGQQDVDKDSIGDVCDPDLDGDGIANASDNCSSQPNANQSDRDGDGKGDLCDDDRDGDGVKNDEDNCPDASNADQTDQDHDGSGDRCDASIDDDEDGVDNANDNCPTVANPDQADGDADGIGDACDPDADGDGVLDDEDNCPTTRNPDQTDLDADGAGDACDDDLDGDGVANGEDNCLAVGNSDQADGDSDGLGDACDDDGIRTGGPFNAECKLKVRKPFQTAEEWRWPGYGSLPAGLYDYSTLYGNQLRNRVMMTPAVGDIDADGVTDVVFTAYAMYGTMLGGGALVAVDGRNGQTLWASAPAANLIAPGAGIAIANLDNSADHTMEIVAVRYSGGLAVFDSSGAVLWSCASTGNCRDYLHNGMSWGGPAIADLDADGTPEIVYGATAYQRQSSGLYTILWDHSSAGSGAGDNGVGPLSVVADLDLDGSPEVVTGKTAYLADGTVSWDHPNDMDGFAAIGNFDADDYPEIVIVSDARIMLREHDGSIAWGPYALPFPNAALAFRGGAPTVADFDGDGFPEVSVATNGMYAVFDTDGSLLWSTLTQDLSSAATGSSVFDFEGDGWAEVVYNDERKLRVYDGETGAVLFEADNPTATAYEYPVIVDVDGDAQAEIVVASNPYGASSLTGLTCYGDPSWVSTRTIWNQHSYHVTNIEESGTVPSSESASWKSGTFEGWSIGDYGGSYRANATPPLSSSVPAPDLDVVGVDVDRRQCGASVTVRFWVENRGATEAPAGVQVSVYRASVDPANLVETRQTSQALAAGESERMAVVVSGLSADDAFVIVVDEEDAVSECAGKGNNTVEILGAGCP